MDKKNLYYIVVKDTNTRERNLTGEATITTLEIATQRAERDTNNPIYPAEYEAITISDYEETYSDTKPETAKSSMWEEFYWKEKFKAAEYESSYWFKRKERERGKS